MSTLVPVNGLPSIMYPQIFKNSLRVSLSLLCLHRKRSKFNDIQLNNRCLLQQKKLYRITAWFTSELTRNISRKIQPLFSGNLTTHTLKRRSDQHISPPQLSPPYHLKGKGNAVPLQAWSDPESSRKLRYPDFMTTAQDGGKVVSLTQRPPLPAENTPGTHFCYRLSLPQGHSAIGRIVTEKFQWHYRESNPRPAGL
jgi:hypothetical protein